MNELDKFGKPQINIKGFKKVFNKFVQENELGVHRQLRRSLTSPRSLTNSPSRNPLMEQAIRLDAYESPVLSPRDRLRLRRYGKSEKDLKHYVTLVSPRLDRRNSLKKDATEFSNYLQDQLKNLRSITSEKGVQKYNKIRPRRNSI